MSSAVWSDEVQGVTLPPLDAWFASSSDVQAAQARDALKRGHFIYLEPEARARALAHLTARPVEQAGLLVGRVFFGAFEGASESCYIIQITDAIPARDDNATATSVSISPRTWLEVQPLLAEGKVAIGWFHSHPNLGAFFSGTDTKTQRALFHAPYNLGWVVDWIRDEEAWFMGPQSEAVKGVRTMYRATGERADAASSMSGSSVDDKSEPAASVQSMHDDANATDTKSHKSAEKSPSPDGGSKSSLKEIGAATALLGLIFLGTGYFFTQGQLGFFGVSRDSFVRSNEIYIFRSFDAVAAAMSALLGTDWPFWKQVVTVLLPTLVGFATCGVILGLIAQSDFVHRKVDAIRSKKISERWRQSLSMLNGILVVLAMPLVMIYFFLVMLFAYLIPGVLGEYAAQKESADFIRKGGCQPKTFEKLHLHPCVELISEKTCTVIARGLQIAISEKSVAVFDPHRGFTETFQLSENVRVRRKVLELVKQPVDVAKCVLENLDTPKATPSSADAASSNGNVLPPTDKAPSTEKH